MTIQAVYENGVFRPLTPVDLPEHTPVRVEPATLPDPKPGDHVNFSPEGMQEVYALLGHRFDGGDPQVSTRHDEHQP